MKKISLLFFSLFLIIGVNQNLFAQGYDVTLTFFDPLPEVNFAAFAMTNNLAGAPTIMSIEISTPTPGELVVLEMKIEWQKNEEEGFNRLFEFKTQRFAARNITNNDIGVSVRVATNQTNSALIQDNFRKGKPTGSYRTTVILQDANGAEKARDEKTITFLNPTQTLSITSPEAGSSQDVGNVLASWDVVYGASYYGIKANIRNNSGIGLEEALNSGDPIIDNNNVGNVTSASLRGHLIREWWPGQEIVLQVTAFVDGAGGGTTLYSNIINFFIGSNAQLNAQLIDLLQLLSDVSGQDLVQRYQDGQMDFSNLRITLDDGRIISQVELSEILNYLKINPDKIIGISFINK